MTIYVLILVVFVAGQPEGWDMKLFVDKDSCERVKAVALHGAKEHKADAWVECFPVAHKPKPASHS
jgi:hypothetical protein